MFPFSHDLWALNLAGCWLWRGGSARKCLSLHRLLIDNTVKWFHYYLSNQKIFCKFREFLFRNFKHYWWFAAKVYIWSFTLLTLCQWYADGSETVKCNLFLLADDKCLVSRYQKAAKSRFCKYTLCNWFNGNKLSIHFGDDKNKSLLFAPKRKIKKVPKLDIIYNSIWIKQLHEALTYLGRILDEIMSGQSMAHKVISKVNKRLKFLHRKNECLTHQT